MRKGDKLAFPAPVERAGTSPIIDAGARGMTLREWYAGMALIGVIQEDKTAWANGDAKTIAEVSFRIADAMLAKGGE